MIMYQDMDMENTLGFCLQLKTVYPDVPASVLYDVLHDPDYRRTWDKFMMEAEEIGYLNPNNSVSYYACKCRLQHSLLSSNKAAEGVALFHGSLSSMRKVYLPNFIPSFLCSILSGSCEEPRLRDPILVAADPGGRLRHHQPLRLP